MPTMQDIASEAVCSALYNMPFTKFLGERPDPDGGGKEVAWFRLSQHGQEDVSARVDPKQVVVAVRRDDAGFVIVQVSWLNLTRGADHPIRGEQFFRVSTRNQPLVEVQAATQQAVLRVLEIYEEVLTEQGVAGQLQEIAPKSEAGDPDDEADMAVPGFDEAEPTIVTTTDISLN